MPAFGREVADAYIEVHADTDAFRRELRGKLAKEFAGFANEMDRKFSKDLDLEKRANFDGFLKGLRRAAVSGDWKTLHKQFGEGREGIERMADAIDDLGRGGYFDIGEIDEVHEALRNYSRELENDDRWKAIEAENKAWDRQQKEIAEVRAEADKMAEAFRRLDRSTARSEANVTKQIQQRDMAWARYEKSVSDFYTRLARRYESDTTKFMAEKRRQQAAVSTFYRNLASQYERDYRNWASAQEKRDAMLRIQVRARREMDAEFERREKAATTVQKVEIDRRRRLYAVFFDGLKKSRNDFIHGIAVLGDLVATGIGRTIEGTVRAVRGLTRGFERLFGYFEPGGGGFGGLFRDMGKGLSNFASSFMTNLPGLIATVAALAVAFQVLFHSAGVLVSLLSGLAGIVVGLASSLGMALMAIIPLAGMMSGFAYGVGLAVAAFRDMDRYLPGAVDSLRNLRRVFSEIDVTAFAEGIEEPLDRLFTTLARSLEFDSVAAALGGAFGKIISSLEEMMRSPGWKSFTTALETTIPDAVAGFGTGFVGILEGLTSAFGAAGPAAKTLGDNFAAFSDDFAKTMEEMDESGELTEFFDLAAESMTVVSGLAWSLGEALVALFEAAGPAGNDMLLSITKLVDKFTEWAGTTEGKNQIAEWMEFAKEVAGKLWEIVKEVGIQFERLDTPENRAFLLTTLDTVKMLVQWMGNLIAISQEVWWTLMHTAVQAGEAWNSVKQWLAEAEATIERFVSGAGEAVARFGAAILTGDWVTMVGDWFSGVWDAIVQWWGNIDWSEIGTSIIDGFVNGVTNMATGGFSGLVAGIFGGFIDAVKLLFGIESPSTVFAGIGQDVIEGFKVGIGKAWAALIGWVTGKFGELTTKASETWATIKTTAATKWEEIRKTIGDKVEAVRRNVAEKWDNLRSNASAKWSEIKTTISTKVEEIRSAVSTRVESVRRAVSDAWERVRTTTSVAWNNVKTAVSGKIAEVVAVVRGLPGKAVAALGSFATQMYYSGRRAIDGFKEGVEARVRPLINSVVGAINRAIAAARAALGERSPSRVFRKIGQFVGEGFILGVGDTEKAVKKSMESMLAIPSVPGGLLPSGVAYGGNARHVTVAEGAIQVHSNASDGRIVAGKVLDDMATRMVGV